MSQDEMEHLIRAAGYTPKQRTNLYERLVTREETRRAGAAVPARPDAAEPGSGVVGAAAGGGVGRRQRLEHSQRSDA